MDDSPDPAKKKDEKIIWVEKEEVEDRAQEDVEKQEVKENPYLEDEEIFPKKKWVKVRKVFCCFSWDKIISRDER